MRLLEENRKHTLKWLPEKNSGSAGETPRTDRELQLKGFSAAEEAIVRMEAAFRVSASFTTDI
jgi:hypothetical protein